MTENVERWWARRQRSKGMLVPYPVGRYRDDWQRYPVLIRQYHPEFNRGITLTQVPPAADVYLTWQCDVGHLFVATPEEQRGRPGGERRRSTWCPECAILASPPRIRRPAAGVETGGDGAAGGAAVAVTPAGGAAERTATAGQASPAGPAAVARDRVAPYPCGHPRGSGRRRAGGCPICRHARAGADRVAVGEAFESVWAPKPASAAEGELRQRLGERLPIPSEVNAVRVARPFFEHLEVWPDIVFPELRIAIEYDTTGRHGLEHVGRREETDRRKDRLLRAAGWEVIRVRCGKLQALGPYDVLASGVTKRVIEEVIDRMREIAGDLIVESYLRERAATAGGVMRDAPDRETTDPATDRATTRRETA
ncbi:zinc-ribbon domain-containing protein [Galbitalea soli]|uniref:zinc-ribbon domain-containing protein n=1 Tax=Galbitalea soli TaxID=1268042 RepID=UPI0017EFEEAF|nr:hypothetical protein [Galbitalea soli]